MTPCPSCGKETIEHERTCRHCGTVMGESSNKRRLLLPKGSYFVLSLIVLYLPQCWVFFIGTGDSSRVFWQKMFPVLSGIASYIFVCLLGFHRIPNLSEPVTIAIYTVITAFVVIAIAAAGKLCRSKRRIYFTVLLAFSLFLAWFAHGVYAM